MARAPAEGNPADDLSTDRLWQQYTLSVEEYRFQVELNWKRFQYYFVLTVALLAAGVGFRSSPGGVSDAVPITLFVVGALVAGLALFADVTQHGYYENARDTKKRLEQRFQLGEYALETTTGMGATRRRRFRVTTVQRTMMSVLAAACLTGVGATVFRSAHKPAPPQRRVELAVRVHGLRTRSARVLVVVSRAQRTIDATSTGPDGAAILSLAPGPYEISVLGQKVCSSNVVVTSASLQLAAVSCR